MEERLELLANLTNLRGMSGYEKDVREYLREKLEHAEIEVITDNLGGIGGVKKGNGPKILIAGHMDEIGFIVTNITEEGYLKFNTVGGWWSQVMLAQQYDVTTQDGKVYRAVMGSKPPHLLTEQERNTPASIPSMYLDLGMTSKKEVEALGVKVGDMITPTITFQELNGGDYLLAKAFDNRVGCAVSLEVLKTAKCENTPNSVYGVMTVQEEVGLRGARVMGQKINPDIVIALDVTVATDTPGLSNSCKLGKGPAILLMDGGLIGHRGLRKFVTDICDELNIPYQIDYLSRGSTDAGQMHLAHDGAPAMSLCVPARYIHSHTSVISKTDYYNTIKLLEEVVRRLDSKKYEEILNA